MSHWSGTQIHAAWLPPKRIEPPKTIREWREARGMSDEDLARLVDVTAQIIRDWEHRGYDPTAQCGFALARALRTPVDTIIYGRYVRGLTLPGCQFILAARGRDDLGWKARIVEWRGEGSVDRRVAARANAGWLKAGASAEQALDTVEQGIRAALDDRQAPDQQEAP